MLNQHFLSYTFHLFRTILNKKIQGQSKIFKGIFHERMEQIVNKIDKVE